MSELLPLPEQLNIKDSTQDNNPLILGGFNHVLEKRKSQLKTLEGNISKKLFYLLEKRIEQERMAIKTYLGLAKTYEQHRQNYTNILDSQYFEQKIL